MIRKTIKEYDFFILYDRFTSAMKSGKRLQKNGKRISPGTRRKYLLFRGLMEKFCKEENFQLRLVSSLRLNRRRFKAEQKYWKKFYLLFTAWMQDKNRYSDNYSGMNIKSLRCFFNYLNQETGLSIGEFHKNFYAPSEEIQIVVLSPERLTFLINNKEFETLLPARLQKIKDIFVFGCTVALRVSDLMNLKPENLEYMNDRVYLRVLSKKSQTFTRICLPKFAMHILEKYQGEKYLLPRYHPVSLNKYGKELMEKAGWTEPMIKTRQRRGIAIQVYKNADRKTPYRFCDMVTSHTMRRTAITTMLSLGMKEHFVRQISGHAPTSKEFWRYVAYAQTYIDEELELIHKKLAGIQPEEDKKVI